MSSLKDLKFEPKTKGGFSKDWFKKKPAGK